MLSRAVSAMLMGLAFAVCSAASGEPVQSKSAQVVRESNAPGADASSPERRMDAAKQRRTPLSIRRQGDILMARKMYREAIETYLEANLDAAVIYTKIGIAHHELNDLGQALEYYERALSFDPASAEARNNSGTVYAARGDHKRAIKHYEEALERSPQSAPVYCNLGTAQFARRKYDKAIAAYQRVLELDPAVLEGRQAAGSLFQIRKVAEPVREEIHRAARSAREGEVERARGEILNAFESAEKPAQKEGLFEQLLDIFK